METLLQSAAGDARAGEGLALIKGVGVEGGGAALPGAGLTDALDEISPSEVTA